MAAKHTIIVINDNAEILSLFRELLSGEGYRIIVSSYTLRQIDTIVAEKPDLVILDLAFGREFTGWQTLQTMRMCREAADIPVIVCTAEIQKASEIQGYLTGHGVGLLLKPFNISQLFEEVRLALNPV